MLAGELLERRMQVQDLGHEGILRAAETDLCAECHSGPEFSRSMVHEPAATDCTSCHQPHGSAQEALLVQAGEALCASCHDGADGFAASHGGFSVAGASCTSCHAPQPDVWYDGIHSRTPVGEAAPAARQA